MARLLDKDPATYGKERDGFVRDLQHFHETRGTPFRRYPVIGGHEIDLFLLYSLVTAKGGWMKVNSRNEWETIYEQLELSGKCVNSGVALKQIYIRYLDRYEKVHFLGHEGDRGSDDDEESRHKRWSARALHSVPLSYNYHQHNIADSTRNYNGLSDNLYKASDYDRLALSLISPLPNEQDFAVNVCTLLCNEGKHTLKLEKCPRLVDYLLAHTGIFNHCSLRQVFTEVYSKLRKCSLNSFWSDTIDTRELLDLTNENNFLPVKKPVELPSPPSTTSLSSSSPPATKARSKSSVKTEEPPKNETQPRTTSSQEEQQPQQQQSVDESRLKSENDVVINSSSSDNVIINSDTDSDSERFLSDPSEISKRKTKGKGFKLKLEPGDQDLFCLGRSLGTQDYIGQRVLQIANILRNLSFSEENISVLAANRTFLRFLLLCVRAQWNSMHQLGLDMLSNIASELVLKDQKDRLTECLMQFVTTGLHSPDRVVIIACLEILNKLSQQETNEEFMLKTLEQKTYAQVCSFLTLHDVMLLIYTLECLYSLSSLGEKACNYIVDVHGIIDTLVSLVTVEGKSYGPKACIGMKLVETVPGTAASNTTTSAQTSQPPATTVVQSTATVAATTPARNITVSTLRNIAPATPKTIVSPSPVVTPVIHHPSSSKQQGSSTITTMVTTVTSSALTTPTTLSTQTQQSIQQQHAHQQAIQENEQFALAWLRATYEPCGHGKIEQQELYKQYLNSCAKIGRRGVIAPLHFPRCVRSVFGGTVGPNPIKGTDSVTLQYYEGIRARIVPLIITLPSAALQQTVQNKAANRRGIKTTPIMNTTVITTTNDTQTEPVPVSPASPILKAQLSAPPKPRESPTKIDVKSQVLAHPHLSQALLGNSVKDLQQPSTSTASTMANTSGAAAAAGQSNTSLIKTLLATKVNECMIPVVSSMKSATSVIAQDSNTATALVAQVAQRQQHRLLAQQQQQNQQPVLQSFTTVNKKSLPKPQPKSDATKSKISRMNGIRLPPDSSDNNSTDNVSSTSQILENHLSAAGIGAGTNSAFRGRREPPQPPPPPLAPLSATRAKTPRMDIEDSDSTGNNSVASSTGISSSNVALSGGISSTEDGDNSLTSFEGILLNGMPHTLDIDAPCDDSNSKDSVIRNSISPCKTKPLMLADLLEKKVDKDPPILNGIIGKELRIGDKGLELVDNHINKILNSETTKEVSVIVSVPDSEQQQRTDLNNLCSNNNKSELEQNLKIGIKRPADEDLSDMIDTKKRNLASSPSTVIVSANNLNGGVDSPKPESVDSNGDENGANASVSATAANLYASLAADLLEDEDEELLQQEAAGISTMAVDEPPQPQPVQMVQTPMHQMIAVSGQENQQQQLIMTGPRQIIVSQGQSQQAPQQVFITAGGQILQQTSTVNATNQKIHTGHQTLPMLVSGGNQQRTILSQSNSTPILLQHGLQGQLQLVNSTGQPGQYVLSTGGPQGTHYVVAQPQTALVQGQAQTVLVAQTPQQQGTATKTIIILQPQTAANTQSKVMMTSSGQQVVVTQVQRPLLQQSTVSNNIPPALVASSTQCTTPTVIKSTTQAASTTVLTHNALVNNSATKMLAPKDRVIRPQTQQVIVNSVDTSKPVASTSTTPTPIIPTIVRDYTNPFICEWRGCAITKRFKSANEVYMHACEAHCPPTPNGEELQCLWERCDSMKRKRFSLMTHLNDRHCSPEIMKMMCARRKQLSQSGKTEIPTPATPPPHPGYAPDAALHAIKRHALEFVNPKELQQKTVTKPGATVAAVPARPGNHTPDQDDNEGPVTKSIRLTASLILRNLVIYSHNSRRYLRHYEPHLAGVALSNVESSRTIAQLLYDMNDSSTGRR